MASAQATHQQASDPARRFVELLASAITSRRAYLTDSSGECPSDAELWGWTFKTSKDEDGNEDRSYHAHGDRVGWVDRGDVYLDPDASFKMAQSMALGTGEGIAATGGTLRRRLRDRGYLASHEGGRDSLTIRKMLGGERRHVLHVKASTLIAHENWPNSPNQPTTLPDGSETAINGSVPGPVADQNNAKLSQENGPSGVTRGGNGPDGSVGQVSEPCNEHRDSPIHPDNRDEVKEWRR